MSRRNTLNQRRGRRAERPKFCRECARKGLRTRLNSHNQGDDCGPCRQAAVQRLLEYP